MGRILLVDNDPVSGYTNERLLRQMDVTEHIDIANCPHQALEWVHKNCVSRQAENCFDTIFLDVATPGIDLFEFVEVLYFLHKEGTIHMPRVVLLTSSFSPDDRARAEAFQVYDYILKPITQEKIKQVLLK
ncbi:response regulator [Pontibacter silvestris]|uniref:Response regulator n=1 Tax=Pontibacter silvestris TaxID=2305183 RepID=A0ABW4X1M4_9BACT|nr:response regulator [Pontibacter silvestris]MCC9135120.1 response regulator [Pontibacter silvestris]